MSKRKKRNRYGWGGFPEYIPVAARKEEAAQKIAALKKKGQHVHPVIIHTRAIATTFWGKAWCKHLESYADAEYRLERGRSYVRHGAVLHLEISEERVDALVNGSSIYKVQIDIHDLAQKKWNAIVQDCSGKVGSLIELLQGKLDKNVMEIITDEQRGLFPDEDEIRFSCSCPDYAHMCKHVAAVLYGIGNRLDEQPESLFTLRKVNQVDLVTNVDSALLNISTQETIEGNLSALFGIEIEEKSDSIQQKKTDASTNKSIKLKKQKEL